MIKIEYKKKKEKKKEANNSETEFRKVYYQDNPVPFFHL